MPFLIMRRTDIPDGALQALDLVPSTSQRNPPYEPNGQSRYVINIPTQDTVALTGTGPITTSTEYGGLAAYLVDNVEEGGAEPGALTAAVANSSASAITAQAISGGEPLTLADINALLVGNGAPVGTDLEGNESTGSVKDVLDLLSGRNYVLPAGSEVEDSVNIFNSTRLGAFDGGTRRIGDSVSFRISAAEGHIAAMNSAEFKYDGTAGVAVEVFEDDGTRI